VKSVVNFSVKRSLVYENLMEGPYFLPKIDMERVQLRILHSVADYEAMIAEGMDVSNWAPEDLRPGLAAGAITFCVFVDKRLAYRAKMALSEGAMDAVDPFPYPVDWSCEAWGGHARAHDDYRRMGLHLYAWSERLRYAKSVGCTRCLFTVRKGNHPAVSAQEKLGSRVVAEGITVRVAPWTFCRYRPVRHGATHGA